MLKELRVKLMQPVGAERKRDAILLVPVALLGTWPCASTLILGALWQVGQMLQHADWQMPNSDLLGAT
jgi:hypothetical protein